MDDVAKWIAELREQGVEEHRIELAEHYAKLGLWQAAFRTLRKVICGSPTRRGSRCMAAPEPPYAHCRWHGGASKTPEGIKRIRQAQLLRWQRWRDEQNRRELGLLPE